MTYYAPPPRHPQVIAEVSNLGSVAMALIGVSTVGHLIGVLTSWRGFSNISNHLQYSPGYTYGDMLADQPSGTSLTRFTTIAAAVLFLIWLRNARRNAERFHPAQHRADSNWVVLGWFCPGANFVFPYQVVDDIWRTSDPAAPPGVARARDLPGSRLVLLWWVTWTATISLWVIGFIVAVTDLSTETYRLTLILDSAAAVLCCFAAVFVIQVIRQISRWQTTPRPPMPPRWQ